MKRDSLADDAVAGVKLLAAEADIVMGSGERIDGAGATPGQGYFFGPTLLRARDPQSAEALHRHEVFGPVATLMPYDGDASTAACLVARSNGTLVVSIYANDEDWVQQYLSMGGAFTGRLYLGSEKMASQAFGSGVALPMSQHGGPGRAGGGSELGGAEALHLYTQRVALQGAPKMLAHLAEAGSPVADEA